MHTVMTSCNMLKAFKILKYSSTMYRESRLAFKCNYYGQSQYKSLCTGKQESLKLDTPMGTVQQVKEMLQKKGIGDLKGIRPMLQSRAHLSAYLPSSQDELPPRTMQDSFHSAILPLSTDLELQDKYMSFLGHVRIGRVLEDMDIMAGWIAYQHILNPKIPEDVLTPYTLVTVLVDQVDFEDSTLKGDADIRLSGHVSWVGTSSLEIVVWLEQKLEEKWTKLTRSLFLMAARDPTHRKSAIVNRLVPGNADEQKIIDGGEERKKRRRKAAKESLLKVIPNEEEQLIIHDLFLKSLDVNDPSFTRRVLPECSIWMADAQLTNTIYSHPENRNIHNKVFGGFLMRQALELSWACGWVISKQRPKLLHISDIIFHKPVEVSSLIKMGAQVVYSEEQFMQIMVHAEVYDPKSGIVCTTNVFHFTYQMPKTAPSVVPNSYHEAMLYLDGRRHFQKAMCKKPI